MNFRKIGYTDKARNYPLSPRAQDILLLHTGVDRLPSPEWGYAANYRMQAWYDLLGAAREAGKPYRDADGRFWTPARLLA